MTTASRFSQEIIDMLDSTRELGKYIDVAAPTPEQLTPAIVKVMAVSYANHVRRVLDETSVEDKAYEELAKLARKTGRIAKNYPDRILLVIPEFTLIDWYENAKELLEATAAA